MIDNCLERACPPKLRRSEGGAIAQLGERVLCKHEVVGSIPSGSTILRGAAGKDALRSLGEGGLAQVARRFGWQAIQ